MGTSQVFGIRQQLISTLLQLAAKKAAYLAGCSKTSTPNLKADLTLYVEKPEEQLLAIWQLALRRNLKAICHISNSLLATVFWKV